MRSISTRQLLSAKTYDPAEAGGNVFPETDKTAFDVAREIALQRTNADG